MLYFYPPFLPTTMPELLNSTPENHRKALEFVDKVTTNADAIQKQVLSQILTQNACTEYLHNYGLSSADLNAFHRRIPVVSYEDIQPYIQRIANGDKSPILSGRPISEFLTSSGTSGGERKLMPTIEDEMDRRAFFYSLQMPIMSQFVDNLDKGKAMYFHFIKSESKTPGGHLARPVLTSYYKSRHFIERPFNPFTIYTSPIEAVLCTDSEQSVYAQLLCGLVQNSEVIRVGSVFASGFLRAIRFLENQWPRFCHDIRTGTLDSAITDKAVRVAVEQVLRPDPVLADQIEAECRKDSWKGIIPRIWPNTKYIEVIVTGTMSQYIPTLDFYSNGLPLACTMYGSSECYFGLNLNPTCKPGEVAYTLIPTMAYFEFLPTNRIDSDKKDLVALTDVKLGREYELVITTYAGLCRYRVGDVLRVAGFKNKAPQFNFIRRKNVALSVDSDKTDEIELHTAVTNATTHLVPFGAYLLEYTSFADTTSIPGHYVLYWEIREGGTKIPPSVFEDCCLAIEESLNSVYRQGRASDKSIGPLEIRLVEQGAFDGLMDYALSQGASINQYKAPRCLKSKAMVKLMDSKVMLKFSSPKCPKWVCGHKQWMKEKRCV